MKSIRAIAILLIVSLSLTSFVTVYAESTSEKRENIEILIEVYTEAYAESGGIDARYIEEADILCISHTVDGITAESFATFDEESLNLTVSAFAQIQINTYNGLKDSLYGTPFLFLYKGKDQTPIALIYNDTDISWMLGY